MTDQAVCLLALIIQKPLDGALHARPPTHAGSAIAGTCQAAGPNCSFALHKIFRAWT